MRACDRFNCPIAVSRAQVGWIRDAIINPLKRQKHPQSLRLELWMRILEGESRRLSRRDARGDSEVCRGRGLDARRRAHECFGFLSPAYFIPGLRNAFRLLEGRRISRPFQADGVASRAALSRHGSLLVARFSASCISLLSYCAARQSGGPTRARGTQTATGRGPLSFSLPPSLLFVPSFLHPKIRERDTRSRKQHHRRGAADNEDRCFASGEYVNAQAVPVGSGHLCRTSDADTIWLRAALGGRKR